jgi:cytochrome c-type biogenesis protein CcmE
MVVVGLVIAGAIGFLLWQGLGNATVYFKTADEAVRDKESLGSRRFRVEGVVVPGTVAQAGDAVRFDIEERGATVSVRHQGDPPELFRPGIPVVLEGHWQGAAFASDRIMVKHTSEYRAEHPDRVTTSTP